MKNTGMPRPDWRDAVKTHIVFREHKLDEAVRRALTPLVMRMALGRETGGSRRGRLLVANYAADKVRAELARV